MDRGGSRPCNAWSIVILHVCMSCNIPCCCCFALFLPCSVLISLCFSLSICHRFSLLHPHFTAILSIFLLSAFSCPLHPLIFSPSDLFHFSLPPTLQLPYCECFLRVTSLQYIYCAVKCFDNRVTVTADLMKGIRAMDQYDDQHNGLAFYSGDGLRQKCDAPERNMSIFHWRPRSPQHKRWLSFKLFWMSKRSINMFLVSIQRVCT